MKKLAAAPALLSFVLTAFAADEAVSPPVGGMTITIAAGSQISPFTTSFAMPLHDIPAANGNMRGVIASRTTSSITVTNAGWTSGGLSMAAFPYAVRISSGSAEGLTAVITSNTADTLTVSGADLAALGVTAGDRYSIIPVDTLSTLFGSNTLLGGTSADEADIVTLSSTSQLSYYYNTTSSRWVRITGPTTDRGNTPILPDSVVSIVRKSSQLSLTLTGRVPDTAAMVAVSNTGSTYSHAGFPTDVTLGTLALQNRIAGWVSSASSATADLLGVNSGGSWLFYFHNGSNWQRITGPATNRDNIVIPAGAALRYYRVGAGSGVSYFRRAVPYSI